MVEQFTGEKRLLYVDGLLLSAADFQQEQQYILRMRRRHNQALHGSGVATGLSIGVSAGTSAPSVVVEPGMALDGHGREVVLTCPVTIEIATTDASQYVIVEYAERETDQMVLLGDADITTPSRIEEGAIVRLASQVTSPDGVTIGRIVAGPSGWQVDGTFEPTRCR